MGTTTLCTGLSDFHKMVVTVMKSSFEKMSPKEISYRNYKNFDNNVFKLELSEVLSNNVCSYKSFEEIFLKVLDKNAPLKKKIIRANHAPYMTKNLRKAIMKRSLLEKVYFKKLIEQSLRNYKKQNNYCRRQ